MKDAGAWGHELDFEGRQQHHARAPGFVGCHRLEMFAFPLRKRDEFSSQAPHGWGYKSNRCLVVPTPVMLSNLVDHPRMLSSRVQEHLSDIAEVEIAVTTLDAFLRTVRYGVISRFTPDALTRV